MARTAKHKESRTPVFNNLHLIDPLPRSPILDSEDAQEAILMEALARGAAASQLFRLRHQWRSRQLVRHSPRFLVGQIAMRLTGDGDTEWTLQADGAMISGCVNRYRTAVAREFRALPDHVRKAFAEDAADALQQYFVMRAEYYKAGYSNPYAFLSQIEETRLLGHNITGGLHPLYAQKIARLRDLLESWSPGLSTRVAKEFSITSKGKTGPAGGFVPRFIAPKQDQKKASSLSNHDFGLAIDIDSAWNPHIKDRDVINILKGITGFDFGKRIVPDESTIAAKDWAAQTHLQMSAASKRLQEWLQKYLPIYEREYPPAVKKRGVKPASIPGDANEQYCENLDAETAAQMNQVAILLKHHTIEDLRHWKQHGIETIPMELAAAMAELGISWGACWKSSKDIMHFELDAKAVLPPDSDPRPLDDLFSPGNEAAIRLWLGN